MCSAFAVKDPNLKSYSLGTVEAVTNKQTKNQTRRKQFMSICFSHQVNNSFL